MDGNLLCVSTKKKLRLRRFTRVENKRNAHHSVAYCDTKRPTFCLMFSLQYFVRAP